MEQKKILWIVVIVSVFVLLIFGAALLLYAPSRSTGPTLQPAAAVTQPVPTTGTAGTDRTASGIDPDSWVREPEKTPGLDSNPPAPNGNINLTIVNGDNAGATYGTLDVSGLTQTPTAQEIQPASTQANPDSATTDDTTPQTTIKPAKPATPQTAPAISVKPAKPAKQAPAKAAPAKTTSKEAPKATVAVTEYWIQTGSFSSKVNAEKARENLAARYLNAEIFTKEVKGATTFRVRVGPYKTKDEANYWLGTVKEIAGFSGSFISEVKTKK